MIGRTLSGSGFGSAPVPHGGVAYPTAMPAAPVPQHMVMADRPDAAGVAAWLETVKKMFETGVIRTSTRRSVHPSWSKSDSTAPFADQWWAALWWVAVVATVVTAAAVVVVVLAAMAGMEPVLQGASDGNGDSVAGDGGSGDGPGCVISRGDRW